METLPASGSAWAYDINNADVNGRGQIAARKTFPEGARLCFGPGTEVPGRCNLFLICRAVLTTRRPWDERCGARCGKRHRNHRPKASPVGFGGSTRPRRSTWWADDGLAWGINNLGQVVGHSQATDGWHAFLWDSALGMRDLNELLDGSGFGWTVQMGRRINDHGWIAGHGISPTGQQHAILLIPATNDCGDGWIYNPGTTHCYRLTQVQNWYDAVAEANAAGGHLVTINDASENAWLVHTFGGMRFSSRMDLPDRQRHRRELAMAYRRTRQLHTNWNEGEPSDSGPYANEDHAMIYVSRPGYPESLGKWNDGDAP